MRKPNHPLSKALAGLLAALCLSGISSQAVDVPGNLAAGGALDHPGGYLKGEYWKRPPVSILTDGRANRANGIDNQIRTFGTPDGNFQARSFTHLGNDLTPVMTWLGSDAASYSGSTSNLDDGAFRFTGFINVPAAGIVNMGLTSDDGSRITIAGVDIAERDGSHGDETQDIDVNFLAAGLYPIEITYFNGDWTDNNAANCDGSNHSPNPLCTSHGGANFHLRVAGADIGPDQVAAMFHPPPPPPVLVWAVGRDDDGWPVGDGGGPNASFVQENGVINPLPGTPTSPEVNQQADNDYYFAGSYTTVIPANGAYAPIGVVPVNEEAAERAFAAADLDLRYHFNLPNTLQPFDQLSVTFDANNLDSPGAVNTDPRFGIEIYINNVLVQTQILIRPAQLGTDYTSTPVSLASVGARVGPGADNIVSLRGINYNNEGGGNWMGIDYVQLNASFSPVPLVAVGLNFGADDNGAALGLADNAIAGALPQAHWNNLNGPNGTNPALVEDLAGTATPTTISVTWSSPNTWSSTGRPNEENNGFPAGPDRTLMTGFIDTGNTDATKATVTVSGIPADFTSGGYDVLVYHLGGVAGRGGAYTIGGETKFGTPPANGAVHSEDPGVSLADTGTYVRFRGQYGSSFTLTASADPALGAGVNFRAPVNAIQIVKNQNPDAGLVTGYLTKRRYDNIGNGVALADLLSNPKYINDQYDFTCLRTDFSANDANECNECGLVVRGFFIPRVSGPHTFYIAADDGAGLFLSTDNSPANKVLIASEPGWTGRRNFIGGDGDGSGTGRGDPPVNISAPITLIAGNQYYIEGAVKEGGGGDNLDVAVQGPGDPPVADGDRPIFGDRIATKVDLTGSSLAITQNPANAQAIEGNTATFTVVAAANLPLCGSVIAYQWQRKRSGAADFTNIPGANSATYLVDPVVVDDHLAQYRAVITVPGITRTSAPATLEVLAGGCLRVVSAVGSGDFSHIIVSFSTLINQTDTATTDAFNYTVVSSGTVVTGLRFTTANDSPNRDPMTFTLEGTAGDVNSGPWTLIASGNTGLDLARGATAPDIHFPNTGAYRSYRLLFPTVRDTPTVANSMQIAEVVFLDAANNDVTVPGNAVVGVKAVAGSPTSEIATVGTVGGANNHPAAESPDKTIDDLTTTKYLNFARTNTGIIVTPADPGGSLTVGSVALGGDQRSVILTTDPQAENALYVVTVENVQSLVGSPMCASPSNQATFRSYVTGCGGGILEAFNLPNGGVAVSQLTSSPNFPNSPDFRGPISSFDIRVAFDPAHPSYYSTDAREQYGGRLRGFFIAPESGPHTFYFSSDDNGEFWMSTDELPSHKALIARETVWSGSKQWTVSGGNSLLGVGGKKSAPINLQAGHAYYIEALYHEGGGGDNAAVAVQPPSQATPPAEGADALPASLLGAAAPAGVLGVVTISQQPANQSVSENSTATFAVGVNAPIIEDFPVPLCYQWLSNGVEVAGATGPSFSVGPVSLADSGSRFQVKVSIIGSRAISAEAVLNVFVDTNGPTCVSANAALNLSNIVVRFSESLAMGPAQDTFNYSIPGFTVNNAVLNADQVSVTLTLDGALTSGGVTYNVTIQNLTDLAGNPMEPNPCTLTLRTPVISCGFALQELYFNITGGTIAELRANPAYPGSPSLVRYKGLLEANTADEFDNYGTRISGWLRPPVTGNYNFYMSSDDAGEFWLSTDDTPANIQLLASEPVWNGRRDWTGTARRNTNSFPTLLENRSTTLFPVGIPLTAGQMYYFEALMKEGGGGDNLAVAWQPPGAPVPLNGSSPIPGSAIASLADPAGSSVTITGQPAATNVCLNLTGAPQSVSFSVAYSAVRPGNTNPDVFIQWQKSCGGGAYVDIAGANAPTLTFTPRLSDNGCCYRAAIYVPGAVANSQPACLTVTQPNTPPTFTCGTNQAALEDSGLHTVAGWAGGISPHSIPRTPVVYSNDFSAGLAGMTAAGIALVADGALKLTTPINSSYGAASIAAPLQNYDSLAVTWKSLVGGGAGGGADGYSLNIGTDVPADPGYGGEEGIGTGLTVTVDTFDNGTGQDVGVDIKWGGVRVAYVNIPKDDDGSGNFIRKNAFVDANLQLSSAGVATMTYDGNTISATIPNYTGLPATRALFWARTGNANDNMWVDNFSFVGFPVDASAAEAGQTVKFVVTANPTTLFSVQPAVGANGTLTYTPAPNACGRATITVVAMDNGGTNALCGGSDMSAPCTFVIDIACLNDCPTANAQSVVVTQGVPLAITLSGSDPDGDPLSYSIILPPAHGTLAGNPPNVSYTPALNYCGPDGFRFVVNDGECLSTGTVAIVVVGCGPVGTNHCPVAHIRATQPCAVPGLGALTIVSADNESACVILDGSLSTDADGDTLTYTWLVDGVPFASGVVVSNCFEVGSHTITLVVDDGKCTGSDSLDIDFVTACESVEALILDINNSTLVRKNKRPLLASLKAACASFERGNSNSAINQLQAFQNKVRAQISRNNPVEAARFIATAQAIIDAFNCAQELDAALNPDDDGN